MKRALVAALALVAGAARAEPEGRGVVFQGGLSVGASWSYLRSPSVSDSTPGFALALFGTVGGRVAPRLVLGGSFASMSVPFAERTRSYLDGRPNKVSDGWGFGGFLGASLTWLGGREGFGVMPHLGAGFFGYGSPALFGGVGPGVELGVAFHGAVARRPGIGVDLRAYFAFPQLWPDDRQFGLTLLFLAGFSVARV